MNALDSYIDAWRHNDPAAIAATVTADVVVIESYGPVYRGAPMVRKWADAWFAAGGRVLGWAVTDAFSTGDRIAAEWRFEYHWDGADHAFDGSTLATVHDGKVASLREYATTAPLYEWRGAWR